VAVVEMVVVAAAVVGAPVVGAAVVEVALAGLAAAAAGLYFQRLSSSELFTKHGFKHLFNKYFTSSRSWILLL